MQIERLLGTDRALQRLAQRGPTRAEVERTVATGQKGRTANRGAADWRVHGKRGDGRGYAVLYDHPTSRRPRAARVVAV